MMTRSKAKLIRYNKAGSPARACGCAFCEPLFSRVRPVLSLGPALEAPAVSAVLTVACAVLSVLAAAVLSL